MDIEKIIDTALKDFGTEVVTLGDNELIKQEIYKGITELIRREELIPYEEKHLIEGEELASSTRITEAMVYAICNRCLCHLVAVRGHESDNKGIGIAECIGEVFSDDNDTIIRLSQGFKKKPKALLKAERFGATLNDEAYRKLGNPKHYKPSCDIDTIFRRITDVKQELDVADYTYVDKADVLTRYAVIATQSQLDMDTIKTGKIPRYLSVKLDLNTGDGLGLDGVHVWQGDVPPEGVFENID